MSSLEKSHMELQPKSSGLGSDTTNVAESRRHTAERTRV
jgi:hypothetical protein